MKSVMYGVVASYCTSYSVGIHLLLLETRTKYIRKLSKGPTLSVVRQL